MPVGSRGRIVRVDPLNPEADRLRQAAGVIHSGGIVAYPTETYYGLGVDALNTEAVERLFKVKGRDPAMPISIIIEDVKQLEVVAREVPSEARVLIEKFWPGPLTILFWKSERLSGVLTGGTNKIGVRIPDHTVALQFLRVVGKPLTATSANRSGRPGAVSAVSVDESLGDTIDLVLDGGDTPGGAESTIVDATFYPPRLVREGRVPFGEVLGAIGLGLTEDHDW